MSSVQQILMNAIERQMTVISMPVVQMNEDHIHASVTMVTVEMALNVIITLPVLRSGNTSTV